MSRLPEKATTEEGSAVMDSEPYARNRHGLNPKVWQLQQKLYAKAKQEPRFRFYALYDRIYRKDVLWSAWSRVAANDGAPGVDGIRIADLLKDGEALEQLLSGLHLDLKARTYRPSAVKRVTIPKAKGKRRPLGIPTVRDRIAQMAALLVLEPIFEADLLDCSHGFRPGRKAHDALDAIKQAVNQGRHAVLDADLKSYFDTIPHDKLMVSVERRVSDGSVLRLIRQWLRAPIVEEPGQPPRRPGSGTPQGGVLSPLLANVYLHWLDKSFHSVHGPGYWANARLIRYADDFVICARFIDHRITNWLARLMGRLDLVLNEDKTRVIRLSPGGDALDYLGFTIRVAPSRFKDEVFSVLTPSQESVTRAMRKVSDLTGTKFGFLPAQVVVANVNRFLQGWSGYFRYGYAGAALRKVDWHAQCCLVRHLKRRSQRPYRRPKDETWYQHLHGKMGLTRMAGGCRLADV